MTYSKPNLHDLCTIRDIRLRIWYCHMLDWMEACNDIFNMLGFCNTDGREYRDERIYYGPFPGYGG
ncbi:MAG: hypothetical protein GY847_14510 [Proteobacteria bacterium]|nr:hypothetical protein [Pseudomonadota bacterium]